MKTWRANIKKGDGGVGIWRGAEDAEEGEEEEGEEEEGKGGKEGKEGEEEEEAKPSKNRPEAKVHGAHPFHCHAIWRINFPRTRKWCTQQSANGVNAHAPGAVHATPPEWGSAYMRMGR